MSEEERVMKDYIKWALQDAVKMMADAMVKGEEFDEAAALEAIAKRTGLPLAELQATDSPSAS
jgi:hypothetical protein